MEYEEFDTLKGTVKENILMLMSKKPYTTEEIAKYLTIKRTSVYHYIKMLQKEDKVVLKKYQKKSYYGLPKQYRTKNFTQAKS